MIISNVKSSIIMDINSLPDEIWTEIFQRMTAKERKPFRIASRRLSDCCNRVQIQKIEKLHLPGISYLKDIADTLLTSRRSVMNLKFSNHRLESLDNWNIWWGCGQKIKRLELENCALTLSSMEAILVECSKLSHLAFRNVHILYAGSRGRFDEFFTAINQRSPDVKAVSLKTLVLRTDEIFSLQGVQSLVTIFPNVFNLALNFHHFPVCVGEDTGGVNYSCEKFITCLATKLLQLERLTLNIKEPDYRCDCEERIHNTDFKRLKTMTFLHNETTCKTGRNGIYFPRVHTFTNSLSKNLVTIEFSYGVQAENITNVLQKLPKLRDMNVNLTKKTYFPEFVELYKALANSKLVVLKFFIGPKCKCIGNKLSDILHDRSLPVNSTVRELKIIDLRGDLFLSVFLKCFSTLTRLKLMILKKNTGVADIFYKTNLKCIELKTKLPNGNDRNTLNSIQRSIIPDLLVENLEYLRIEIGILKGLLMQQPSIFFLNLRYLHLSRHRSNSSSGEQLPLTQWDKACLPLYNLEGVFMAVERPLSDLFTFFSNPHDFPRIQYIGIRISPNLSNSRKHPLDLTSYKKRFESWFELCPCLKIIFLMHRNSGFCLCYDPVRREIREFRPGSTIYISENTPYDSSEELNEKIVFRYFHNVRSFYDFWLNKYTV